MLVHLFVTTDIHLLHSFHTSHFSLGSQLANLGNESVLGKTLGNALITILFNDLPHPPTSLVGHANKYRSADGSGNNLFVPELGKAGAPYVRNVSKCHS